MSRLSSFVLGYHGCDKDTADQIINRRASLAPSDNKFDWLGPGIYFWEANPFRALDWARERCREKGAGEPFVIGAVIDLRECLDLLNRQDQDLVGTAYSSLVEFYEVMGKKLPKNKNSMSGGDRDRRARALDCDVIRHLHSMVENGRSEGPSFFDTVRGMFTEGDELYPGAAFYRQSHVQIAVRNPDCIRGLFYPPELDDLIAG